MTTINRVAGAVIAPLMSAMQSFAPIVSLAVLSLLTAIGLLLVIRVSSSQRRVAAVKRSIRAGLFEIRLFNHDLRAILRAQREILRHNLAYLRLSLTPMLWALVPLLLLTTQLQAYYGYDGLAPGRSALVKVVLDDNWRTAPGADAGAGPLLTLEAPPGIRIDTPRVWIPSLNEAAWRVSAEQPGDYQLVVRMQGEPFTKAVRVSDALTSRSAVRPGPGLLAQLLHPIEAPLPADSRLESIAVTYPERAIRIAGRDTHWMIVFVALTMVCAFALKGRFGVVL